MSESFHSLMVELKVTFGGKKEEKHLLSSVSNRTSGGFYLQFLFSTDKEVQVIQQHLLWQLGSSSVFLFRMCGKESD